MSCDFSVVMDQPGSVKLVSKVEATSAVFVVKGPMSIKTWHDHTTK
jgi:hypothetical protein